VNTIEKMACKRALVHAVLGATRSSGLFTQDVEDMPKEFLGKAEEKRSWEVEQPNGTVLEGVPKLVPPKRLEALPVKHTTKPWGPKPNAPLPENPGPTDIYTFPNRSDPKALANAIAELIPRVPHEDQYKADEELTKRLGNAEKLQALFVRVYARMRERAAAESFAHSEAMREPGEN